MRILSNLSSKALKILAYTVRNALHPSLPPSVVDVYTQWCGPCNQMMPLFKALSINIDYFEDRINVIQVRGERERESHAQVPASAVSDFEKYEGTSQPRFVLYKVGSVRFSCPCVKEGHLVTEVVGANAPQLLKAIDHNLPPPPDTD